MVSNKEAIKRADDRQNRRKNEDFRGRRKQEEERVIGTTLKEVEFVKLNN